jgi:hypothetical protein
MTFDGYAQTGLFACDSGHPECERWIAKGLVCPYQVNSKEMKSIIKKVTAGELDTDSRTHN